MKPYLAMLRARALGLLQYRVAALAGLGTQVFWGFIRVMIFTAFYRSTVAPQPMSLEEVIGYVWLGQATLMLILWRPDPEIEQAVRSGNIAYELLRPVDLYAFWFARSIADRATPTVLRAVPLFVVALLFLGLPPPASTASFLAWLAASIGALFLSSAIATVLMISLMWTVSGRGITILVTTGAWVFSGITLPLPLFPDWAQSVLAILPFAGLMDTPFRLYLGNLPPEAIVPALAHQLVWCLAFVGLGRWLVLRGTRRLVVQGG